MAESPTPSTYAQLHSERLSIFSRLVESQGVRKQPSMGSNDIQYVRMLLLFAIHSMAFNSPLSGMLANVVKLSAIA